LSSIEGHETLQRIVAKDTVLVNGLPIWRIDDAVLIENSRIVFYVKEFGCYFDIAVKQGKGQGAYYVREWTKLPNNIKKLLEWWLDHDQEYVEAYHRAEDLLNDYKQFKKITSGDFAGRMSELRGLRYLFPNPSKLDEFKLDYVKVKQVLENNGLLKVKV
tara:strand:+ start:345 stop:824 length:480 start_codon:yes stop_codon:yes gene_type:complete